MAHASDIFSLGVHLFGGEGIGEEGDDDRRENERGKNGDDDDDVDDCDWVRVSFLQSSE